MAWFLKPEWLLELESRRGHLPKQDLGVEFRQSLLEGQVQLGGGAPYQRSVQGVNRFVNQPGKRLATSHGQVQELTQCFLVNLYGVHAAIVGTPSQPVKGVHLA